MNDYVERHISLPSAPIRYQYDVVIIGGGGHGLACAYYLAARHGITRVAVLERSYVGAGNSGRNTTVIRANYGIPEAVAFYQHSLELYAGFEREFDRAVMHTTRGLLWLAHSETTVRAERARAEMNSACGAATQFVTPSEIATICPQIDLAGAGRYPVLGASYHPDAATARHDRVVWAYAEAAARHGVHVHPGVTATGVVVEHGRVVAVDTDHGRIGCGSVVAAVGGFASVLAATAGVRLPISTHPLQAAVTDHYAQTLAPVVISSDLLFYVSQTPRGELLFGAEIDRQPSYSLRAGFAFLADCALRVATVLPCTANLRLLRQWVGVCDMTPDYSPIIGPTGVDGFWITTGWGTWGFKAIPAGGEQLAASIAADAVTPLVAPFSLDRFARDRTMADRGSAGTH
jgi:sarcosine oxidase, subunit beta